MIQAKVTTVGNSLGLVLSKEAIARLHVKKGDTVYLWESPEGYTLTPYDKAFIQQMKLAEEIMQKEKDVLKVLADS